MLLTSLQITSAKGQLRPTTVAGITVEVYELMFIEFPKSALSLPSPKVQRLKETATSVDGFWKVLKVS